MHFATLQLAAVATLLTGAAAAPTPQAPANPINPADVTGNVDMVVGQTLGAVAAAEGPLNGRMIRRQLAPASGAVGVALGAVAATYGEAAGPIIPIPGPAGPGRRSPQVPANPINPADVTGNVDSIVGQVLGAVAAAEGPLNGRRQLAPASGPFAEVLGAVASTYGQAAGPIIPIPGPVGPGKRSPQAPANPINSADVTGNVDMVVGQTLGAVAAAEGPFNGRMVRRQLAPASGAVGQGLGAAAAAYGQAAGPIYAAPVA